MYLAHKQISENVEREQTIKKHCENTARIACERLNKCGFQHTLKISGWLHDMGKYSDNFAEYLNRAAKGENVNRGSVNHTAAGMIYVLDKYHTNESSKYEKRTSELIAYIIGSHHGLFDAMNLEEENGFINKTKKDKKDLEYDKILERFFSEQITEDELNHEFKLAEKEVENFFMEVIDECKIKYSGKVEQMRTERDYLWGLLIRMLASAIMYGDRVDTAMFFQNISENNKTVDDLFWQQQLNYMESKLCEKENESEQTPLNKERHNISIMFKNFSENGNGIYKADVPTAGGKTLSTLRYGYALAAKEKKNRVIFVIPLLSVLEQNSDVIKDNTLDFDRIGEHHSNIVQVDDKDELLTKSQLIADFWDEPIIITTLYQLLMNCFSNTTSFVSRFSALVNCVIIFDEVQSIPYKNTYLFNMVLNFLNKYFNTTIIMCSATQPCFDEVEYPLCFSKQSDIIPFDGIHMDLFKRVNVHNLVTEYGWSNNELTQFAIKKIEKIKSLLIICNTKKQSLKLYKCIKEYENEATKIFHLSNNMCMQHRRDIMREINEALSADNHIKVICISTQLVEAGIDFSFESVIRSLAGIDNVIQAFGRCNRSFEYGEICDAYIVRMKEEDLSHLKEIIDAQNSTSNLLEAYSKNPDRFDDDIIGKKSILFYYRSLFMSIKSDFCYPWKNSWINTNLLKLLSCRGKSKFENEDYFTKQAFLSAGKEYKVFDNYTIDIIVPYKKGKEIVSNLCSSMAKYDFTYQKRMLKEAKNYSIQTWCDNIDNLRRQGMIQEIVCNDEVLCYELDKQFYSEAGFDEESYFY